VLSNQRSVFDDYDESSDEAVQVHVPVDTSSIPEPSRTFELSGRINHVVSHRQGHIIFTINGKNMSPESAFNTMNVAAFIAAQWCVLNPNKLADGEEFEIFIAMALESIALFGPMSPVGTEAVAASIVHIKLNKLDAYTVMQEKKRLIKDNAPREFFADAVMSGITATEVDVQSGAVAVLDRKDLTIRATETLGLLNKAVCTSPVVKANKTLGELSKLNSRVTPVEEQLLNMYHDEKVPTIKETNSFRAYSDSYGLMSSIPVVSGTHGLLQLSYECLHKYSAEKPDVMLVPGYNQTLTGRFDSCGSASRVIPVPDKPELRTLLLGSIMVGYDELLERAKDIEDMIQETKTKGDADNARILLHKDYGSSYEAYISSSRAITSYGVKTMTIYGPDPISTKKFQSMNVEGMLDDYPVLMRAADYLQLVEAGDRSNFVFVDLPCMIGLRISYRYAKAYFSSNLITSDGVMKSSKSGWYMFNTSRIRSAKSYSTILAKYIFAFLMARTNGDDEMLEIILGRFTHSMQANPKMYNGQLTILSALRSVYDRIDPPLSKVMMLVPGFSAIKAYKYTSYMSEEVFQRDVKSPPPLLPDQDSWSVDDDQELDGDVDQVAED